MPAAARSAGVNDADNVLAPPNAVVRGEPLMRITEFGTYPVPVSTREVLALPACVVVGVSEVMLGTGFATFSGKIFELPPFGCGLTTATCTGPALATSESRILAWSEVELTKPVVRESPFTVTTALPVVTPDGLRPAI